MFPLDAQALCLSMIPGEGLGGGGTNCEHPFFQVLAQDFVPSARGWV